MCFTKAAGQVAHEIDTVPMGLFIAERQRFAQLLQGFDGRTASGQQHTRWVSRGID